MHKKKNVNRLTYYARILFIISLTLLLYGLYLDYKSNIRLFDPVDDVKSQNQGNTINITTIDDTEVVLDPSTTETQDNGNEAVSNDSPSTNTKTPSNTKVPGNNKAPSNTKESNNSNNESSGSSTVSPSVHTPTLEEINQNLRSEIENSYGITVRYGSEIDGYSVGGFGTTTIYDASVANNQLNALKTALGYYPNGLFTEIKNGGIPLSVYLIGSYSNNNITGVTDSSYNYAVISISAAHPFNESFFHESYHYIERFLFKRGANFNTWNSINPNGFTYGVIDQRLSYTYGFNANSPFVNDYAQSSAEEDRASTFEYMMASSKASCLNNGTIVHEKAMQMALTMDVVLNTVSPNVTEYWERYL